MCIKLKSRKELQFFKIQKLKAGKKKKNRRLKLYFNQI